MLSDLERNRLKTRETDPPKTRAINDMRVKKKLRAWLDDGFDALEIFHAIPEDKLKEELTDRDIYQLLTLARYILVARRFMAIQGELEKPDGLEAIGYDVTRPADSTDIARSVFVDFHVNQLKIFVGPNNPAPFASEVSRIFNTPGKEKYANRFTPEEKEGVARINQHIDNYIRLIYEGLI
jgi:hypothetical protein